jgi:hypothetical protein
MKYKNKKIPHVEIVPKYGEQIVEKGKIEISYT